MDGVLGPIYDRLALLQAQVDRHEAVLTEPLAAKAKEVAEAKKAADEKAKADAEKAAADHAARVKALEEAKAKALEEAREQASADLEKAREQRMKEDALVQAKAELAAKGEQAA
jgi:colicin import membrane protein